MPLAVAFISQKGGVGKTTLARALATYATGLGLRVLAADLDLQQQSLICWQQARKRRRLRPPVNVAAFSDATQAIQSVKGEGLVILDTPGLITDAAFDLARLSDLVVLPTSPSADDLHISALVFRALTNLGTPTTRLAFALCHVLSKREESEARSHLAGLGCTVLAGAIPEHLAYREAMNYGRSITETGRALLDKRAEELVADILRKATANADRRRKKVLLRRA